MSDKQRRKDLWNEFEKLLPALVREFTVEDIYVAAYNEQNYYLKQMEIKDYERHD